ncbi:hypothetical protein V3C99_011655 [Haemonchus contortus]
MLICLFAFCQAKEIKQLPGVVFELKFKHYSGFFQVSDTHLLHYWVVESQNEPDKDPLIFWFNGGPGCSSLKGLLKEMGPYLVDIDGKSLRENPYSWNKMASVVYIESPAGVGYSYSTDGNITTNDDQTSCENYEAVKQFFQQTFPQFRYHATYIMGESYAGVYVPTLAERILAGKKDFPINLKQTLGKTPWKFDSQIAGFKTVFEGLTFITVRGAGHKAPRQRAPQMYYAIQQFLLNHPI